MLVSLADMKVYLGIDPGNTTYDAFLTQQLQMVSDTVEGYCGRIFAEDEYVETFYREDLSVLGNVYLGKIPLYHYPVSDVDSIEEFADEEALANDESIDITTFRFHKPTGFIQKNKGYNFFQDGNIMEVTYTAGYATVPTPVAQVVYNIVQERYNKKLNGISLDFGSDVQSISIPGTISVAFDYSLSNNDRKTTFGVILGSNVNILDPYRTDRVVVGSVRLAYVEEA